jgi:hypothetical protein
MIYFISIIFITITTKYVQNKQDLHVTFITMFTNDECLVTRRTINLTTLSE